MELGLQYLHFRGFFPYRIPGGSSIMFSQEFFDTHKHGVLALHGY